MIWKMWELACIATICSAPPTALRGLGQFGGNLFRPNLTSALPQFVSQTAGGGCCPKVLPEFQRGFAQMCCPNFSGVLPKCVAEISGWCCPNCCPNCCPKCCPRVLPTWLPKRCCPNRKRVFRLRRTTVCHIIARTSSTLFVGLARTIWATLSSSIVSGKLADAHVSSWTEQTSVLFTAFVRGPLILSHLQPFRFQSCETWSHMFDFREMRLHVLQYSSFRITEKSFLEVPVRKMERT